MFIIVIKIVQLAVIVQSHFSISVCVKMLSKSFIHDIYKSGMPFKLFLLPCLFNGIEMFG